ncbi:MAG TPA: MFS transporter [Hellea balneolensis]|uniref:MFS transporter n=1 Tax=Hellea balneolensis TaxID=287478 RepID=A0A7V5NW10_9PROT|nr:MFS transporter [Hellea balneolensis]
MVSAIAGQIADKVDRSTILKNIKRAEVLIMLISGLGFLLSNIWILCVSLFFMGAQSAFFSPTKNAVLPQWLDDKELIRGNALLNGFVFVFILAGMVGGLYLIGMNNGPKLVAALLLLMSLIGWGASELTPPAPPPKPHLKVNFEPVSATFNILRRAFHAPHVLKPMLGIAWFYGFSTIMITTLPNYVANVMGYDRIVLIILLLGSTLGILFGSLLCMQLAKWRFWGREAIGLATLGIVGVVVLVTDLYLNAADTSVVGADGVRKGLGAFFEDTRSLRLLIDITLASIFGGLFVVPLQTMAQRRAAPDVRARLMSAGAILLNLAVNFCTFLLIGLGYMNVPPKTPFLIIILISLIVAAYAGWRTWVYKTQPQSEAG